MNRSLQNFAFDTTDVLLWRVQEKSRDGKIVDEIGWESWPHVADVKNYW